MLLEQRIAFSAAHHGYTVGGPGDSTKTGRQPFGRITIANCDSAPGADMKTAIDMAARAVNELL